VTSRRPTAQNGGRYSGIWYVTPMLAVLAVIELTDVVFAIDSIPAIFGVTREPFIVFSATALALIGLRSMFFLLIGARARFIYLDVGLAVILAFIGARFILTDVVPISDELSLRVIACVISAAIGAPLVDGSRRLDSPHDLRPPDREVNRLGDQRVPVQVGFANLAIGLGGIYASNQDEPVAWIAAAIAGEVFLALAGVYHVIEIFRDRNYAPGNTAILISDFGIPISPLGPLIATNAIIQRCPRSISQARCCPRPQTLSAR
jgi:hypothetical protein